MKSARTVLLLITLMAAATAPAAAQVFGQFADAGPAAEGEGAVFMLAGSGAFRTGVSTRFNISRISDFGLQLGIDRVSGESFFGGGFDLRLMLFEGNAGLPLSLSLDASVGGLDSGDVRRFLFGFGVLASAAIETASGRSIEPYASFIVDLEQIDGVSPPASGDGCYTCSRERGETETGTEFRAGAKVPLTADTQVLLELGLDGEARFGAAFNVVF